MRFITILAAVCVLAPWLHAQDDSPVALPAETAQLLREGWSRLQGSPSLPAPRVGVVVRSELGGQPTPAERIIVDDLRSQLTGLGLEILSDEVVTRGLASTRHALERQGEGDVAARTAELIAGASGADIVLLVELVPGGGGTAIRQFRAYDARPAPARLLASETYRALPLQPPADRMQQAWWIRYHKQATTAMLAKLAGATAVLTPYVPTYRLHVLNLSPRDYERWTQALRRLRDSGIELPRLPVEFGRDKADAVPLWIKFPGDWHDLKPLLESSAQETLQRSLRLVFDSGAHDFIVSLQETKEPELFRFAARDAGVPAVKVAPLLSPERRPTVAILYGADLEAPRAALLDEYAAMPKLNLGEESIVRTLGRYFLAAGFEVREAASIRRQLQEEIARAKHTQNLPGMRDALRRSKETDYLVLIRNEEAGRSLALTVLDTRGAQVAFTGFPDLRHKLYADDVDVRDPSSLLRYLGGSLLAQLHDQAGDAALRSIEVVVRNTRDAEQVLAISRAFASLEDVQSVSDLRIDQPLASFMVTTTADVGVLVGRAADLAYRRQLGAKGIVEVANEQQLVLNVAPAWVEEFESPEAERKMEELQRPETPKPQGLVAAMREARDSVWMVGIEYSDGRFVPGSGTAWTVRPGLLATNAHVFDGLHKRVESLRAENIAFRIVARNGEGLQRSMEIDLSQARAHPAYYEFDKKFGSMDFHKRYRTNFITPYDVAILPAKGDAGVPLRLAGIDELTQLLPLSEIGYSGYPMEGRVAQGRSQQSLIGTVNTVTTVFMQDTASVSQQKLIHFSLPAAGGASGSPVFGPSGSVIGLLSAGDSLRFITSLEVGQKGGLEASRSRVPIGFTYGQRVDMLAELIDNTVDMAAIIRGWDDEFARISPLLGGR